VSKSKIIRELDALACERMDRDLRCALAGVTGRLESKYLDVVAGRADHETGRAIDLFLRDSMFRMGWRLYHCPGKPDLYMRGDPPMADVDVDIHQAIGRVRDRDRPRTRVSPAINRIPVCIVVSFSDGTSENTNPFDVGVEHMFGFRNESITAYLIDSLLNGDGSPQPASDSAVMF
jgi:hypothetical protein